MRNVSGVLLGGLVVGALGLALAGTVSLPKAAGAGTPHREARALVERAAELMGGEPALRSIERASLSMVTQWQRATFRGVPHTDRPSIEEHHDVRDYTLGAWRNTRDFGARKIVNVIRDSVAVSDLGRGFQPLSVAYVDERDELFTYTPDRLIVALLDATDLTMAADTSFGGEHHRSVVGTLGGNLVARTFFHTGTGLPTSMHFRAGHPNDYGLVPWGDMEVEVWYSGWRTFDPLSIPVQWDILRVGMPYKRMTVRRAVFNPELEADSFAVSPELRAEYWASSAPLPMHESRSVNGVDVPAEGVAIVRAGFGIPTAGVRTGEGWLVIGAGQAGYNFNQGTDALRGLDGAEPTAVLVAEARTGNGGVVAAAETGLPILVSAAAEPYVRTMLANGGVSDRGMDVVVESRVLGEGADRILLEPIDLPDAPGSLLLYKPSAGWLYVIDGLDPLHTRMARDRADELGWTVSVWGTARDPWPLPEG